MSAFEQGGTAGLPEVIGSVGALVETPLFFPGFSGRLNLRLLAETGGASRARVARRSGRARNFTAVLARAAREAEG